VGRIVGASQRTAQQNIFLLRVGMERSRDPARTQATASRLFPTNQIAVDSSLAQQPLLAVTATVTLSYLTASHDMKALLSLAEHFHRNMSHPPAFSREMRREGRKGREWQKNSHRLNAIILMSCVHWM